MARKIRIAAIVGSGLIFATLAIGSASAGDLNGSGKLASETRKLGAYHAIKFNLVAELAVDVGSAGELSIEADDNLLPHITTKVTNGELEIGCDQNIHKIKKITIKAKTATLDQLTTKSVSSTFVKGLSGPNFGLKAEGVSSTTLSGKVKKLTASIEGTSSLKATELSAESAIVSIAGTGSAEVNVTNDLDATISGIGSIKYKGNPKVTKHKSGLGSIEKI